METISKLIRIRIVLVSICIFMQSFQLNGQPQMIETAECQNFFICLEKGDLNSIKLCLEKNPEYLIKTNCWGHTPLMVAASAGQSRLVSYLLKKGVNIDTESPYGYRAIHLAVQSGDIKTVKILVENGADVECKNQGGDTPFKLAVQSENDDLVQYLLR